MEVAGRRSDRGRPLPRRRQLGKRRRQAATGSSAGSRRCSGRRLTNEIRFQWGRDFEFQTSQAPIAGEPVVAGTDRSPDVIHQRHRAFEFGKPNFLERRSVSRTSAGSRWATPRRWLAEHASGQVRRGLQSIHDTLDNLFQEGGVYTYPAAPTSSATSSCNTEARTGDPAVYIGASARVSGPTAFEFATDDYAGLHSGHVARQAALTLNWGCATTIEQMPDPQIPNPLEPRDRGVPEATRTTGDRVLASTGTPPATAIPSCAAATASSTAASSTRRSRTPSRTPASPAGQLSLTLGYTPATPPTSFERQGQLAGLHAGVRDGVRDRRVDDAAVETPYPPRRTVSPLPVTSQFMPIRGPQLFLSVGNTLRCAVRAGSGSADWASSSMSYRRPQLIVTRGCTCQVS